MQFTAFGLGFAGVAAALAAVVANVAREDVPQTPTQTDGNADYYTLHVAMTPWGPDVLHWWVLNSASAASIADVRKGDLL